MFLNGSVAPPATGVAMPLLNASDTSNLNLKIGQAFAGTFRFLFADGHQVGLNDN